MIGMRTTLALVLLLSSPGTPAWAQLARVVPRASVAPVVPGFAPRLAAPSSAPSFLPSLPTLSVLPLPSPSPLPQMRERVTATAAQAAAPAKAVSVAVAQTALAAAPHIEAAADAGGSAAQGHEAGAALEKVLTGEVRRPTFGGLPVAAFNACDTHPSGLQKAAEQTEAAGPAREVPAPARRAFTLYTAGVSTVKAGIETLNLVVPILLLSQYGAASILGGLFVAAQIASLVGGAALAPVIDRIGPAKTLAAAAAAQAAVIAVVPVSVWLGAPVALPVLFGLFALNGALSGVFDVARRSAPPAILGSDEGTLRRFNARLYIARELAAMGAVFGAGWLLHHFGALATVGIHPAAYVVAAGFFLLLARSRAADRVSERATPPEDGALPSRWSEFAAGARIVLADPALRLAALVNVPVIALHNTFHAMLAAVYATSVLGSPALAAVLIGAWNAGELAAALFLERRGEKTSAAGWVRYAALAGLSAWALWAFPTIYVAAPVAFFLASATLGNEIGLNSFFQSAAPKDRTAAVTGFVYSSATGAAMLAMLGMGWVFDAFGALPGFLALAALLTAVSGLYILAARALARRAAQAGSSSLSSS
ncbi:MFS transporter [bacterium]|nr:MAG: MFS transporter [bacterium]